MRIPSMERIYFTLPSGTGYFRRWSHDPLSPRTVPRARVVASGALSTSARGAHERAPRSVRRSRAPADRAEAILFCVAPGPRAPRPFGSARELPEEPVRVPEYPPGDGRDGSRAVARARVG